MFPDKSVWSRAELLCRLCQIKRMHFTQTSQPIYCLAIVSAVSILSADIIIDITIILIIVIIIIIIIIGFSWNPFKT
jgi:hypothetical protein